MPLEVKKTVYVGTFRHVVDDKKRLAVPSKWRPEEGDKHEFVVMPSPQGCLTVLPAGEVAKMMEKAGEISIGEYERLNVLRFMASESHSSACDSSGRIALTEELLKHAGIDGESLLVGMFNKFEIWAPARFAAVKQSTAPNFAESAKQLGL